MLIEFRVENHRSLRDEQVLSMEAARLGDPTDPRPRKVPGAPKPLLPVVAIYGANASGKSNVLEAIGFMLNFILYSPITMTHDGTIPRSPFGWGTSRRAQSFFEMVFVLGGVRYQYGFTLGDARVEEEWLYAWPDGRKQKWFERGLDEYRFGGHFKGPNVVIKDVTRSNVLFLSMAAQHKHPGVVAIQEFMTGSRKGNAPMGTRQYRVLVDHEVAFLDRDSRLIRERILPLMKKADLGILDIRAKETESAFDHQAWDKHGPHTFEFKHSNDEESWLSLNQESKGTQALFHNAASLLQALDRGTFVLFDELDSSLHPEMAEKIVSLFNDPRTNPRNAQLIFTTHNTNLLGDLVGEPVLRRDQVWFTEKDEQGATNLYPLTDFNPRKLGNIERGYLQGRYGAVPVLGDLVKIED